MKLRKQGERDREGSTQKRIFSYILAQPEGIEERDIRDKLIEETGIREKRGITNHLKKLEDKKVIELRKGKGYTNVWALNTDFETPEDFYNAIEFVFSVANFQTYYLSIQYFLRMNESEINEEFLRYLGITIKNEEVREKVIGMLCLSPSTFHEFITKILPTCQSIDKQIEEGSIRTRNTSDRNSLEKKFADIFFKTDVLQRKGDCVEHSIKTLERYFWADMGLLFLSGINLKKSDCEKIKRIFKMKVEKGSQGTCICKYEITQKIEMCYSPGGQEDTEEVIILME